VINDKTGAADASDTYIVGTTVVTWTVTDIHTNTKTCTQRITITDDEPPDITCPSNISLSISSGICDTVVNYTVTYDDNCSGEVLTLESGIGSGGSFPLGETIVNYKVTDASSNTATCSFIVDIGSIPDVVQDTICVGDSIFLENAWRYTAGIYRDTFLNVLGCDSIVVTELSTTTECVWETAVVFVDSSATGANTGEDWANAYTDLQSALDVASRYGNVRYFYVGRGTYYPTSSANRHASFIMVDSVQIYGGFAGTEDHLDDRDPAMNPTIFSGDIGTSGDSTDNTFHILYLPADVKGAVVDGIKIIHANANGPQTKDKLGAGAICYGEMIIRNCKFLQLFSVNAGTVICTTGNTAKIVLEENEFYGIGNIEFLNENDAQIIFKGSNMIKK
jgi:hypothetical protein